MPHPRSAKSSMRKRWGLHGATQDAPSSSSSAVTRVSRCFQPGLHQLCLWVHDAQRMAQRMHVSLYAARVEHRFTQPMGILARDRVGGGSRPRLHFVARSPCTPREILLGGAFKESSMATCGFPRPWTTPCENIRPCKEHSNLKCWKCGKRATSQCGVAGSLVCGMPECSKHPHDKTHRKHQ
jgi:hypothetical protein